MRIGAKIFLMLAVVLLCCGLLRDCAASGFAGDEEERERLVDTLVYVDTVRYYQPVARDSAVVRYVTIQSPRTHEGGEEEDSGFGHCAIKEGDGGITFDKPADSGTGGTGGGDISLPVISRHYADSTFDAWVSGPLDPRLDSMRLYPRREIVRIKERSPRWGIGLYAGYGITPTGVEPSVGISINYNLLNF